MDIRLPSPPPAAPSSLDLTRCADAVAAALGRSHVDPSMIIATEVVPVDHRIENMTTESLDVVCVTLHDGVSCRLFRKQLRHVSQSPVWESIPDEHRASTAAQLDWLDELRVYRSALADDLPDGLRPPHAWMVDEPPSGPVDVDSTRLELWMEVVENHPDWTLERYARVARRLGAMAARWPEERVVDELGLDRRPLEHLFFGKIVNFDLVMLAVDEFWRQPDIADTVDPHLRADLFELAERVPAMITRIGSGPHGLAHGDATPDNLLEPPDGSTVAVDWSYGHAGAVGSDLAQLLIGRIERGGHHPDDLRDIWDTIRTAFLDGVIAEGGSASAADIDLAMLTHVAVRSVFSAVNIDHRPDLTGEAFRELLWRRAAMARFCIDLIRS